MPKKAIRDLNRISFIYPRISECHRRLIGTGLSPLVAHLIRKRASPSATDSIGVKAVIPGRNDQYAIAVHVDAIRSRPAPGQVRCPLPVY